MCYSISAIVTVLYITSCCVLGQVPLFATPVIVAHEAPLSMEFSRREYWSGLPFPIPGDRPYPEIEPALLCLLHWQADFHHCTLPGKPTLYLGVGDG